MPAACTQSLGPYKGQGVTLGIRPEDLRVGESPSSADLSIEAVVEVVEPLGAEILLVPNGSPYEAGKAGRRMELAVARVVETGLPLVYVNPGFERMTGYRADEVLGRNCRFLHSSEPGQPALNEVRTALRDASEIRVLLRNFRKDGHPFLNNFLLSPVRDAKGAVTHYVGIQDDVTEQEMTRARLAQHATVDPLTGLPNRTLLADRDFCVGRNEIVLACSNKAKHPDFPACFAKFIPNVGLPAAVGVAGGDKQQVRQAIEVLQRRGRDDLATVAQP